MKINRLGGERREGLPDDLMRSCVLRATLFAVIGRVLSQRPLQSVTATWITFSNTSA